MKHNVARSADDYDTALRDFECGDTRPNTYLARCLTPGCTEHAVSYCEDCREEYCEEHLHVIPGFVSSRACLDCLAERLPTDPALQELEVRHAQAA